MLKNENIVVYLKTLYIFAEEITNKLNIMKTFLRKANYQILFAQALALYFLIQLILRY